MCMFSFVQICTTLERILCFKIIFQFLSEAVRFLAHLVFPLFIPLFWFPQSNFLVCYFFTNAWNITMNKLITTHWCASKSVIHIEVPSTVMNNHLKICVKSSWKRSFIYKQKYIHWFYTSCTICLCTHQTSLTLLNMLINAKICHLAFPMSNTSKKIVFHTYCGLIIFFTLK